MQLWLYVGRYRQCFKQLETVLGTRKTLVCYLAIGSLQAWTIVVHNSGRIVRAKGTTCQRRSVVTNTDRFLRENVGQHFPFSETENNRARDSSHGVWVDGRVRLCVYAGE